METLDVSKRSYYILGRHPSTADLVVPHPSVSRQHAVLQHRDTGEIFLYDLGSTHGSTVNKKMCSSRTYIALRIGAMIRLGQSSRTLCLMGSEDPTRESAADASSASEREMAAVQIAEARAEARAERIAVSTGRSRVSAADLHSSGAGWGFSDDAKDDMPAADGDDLERLSFEQLFSQAKAQGLPMSAKQGRLVEQLEKRTAKAENLKTETERIAAKEIDGLSAGQSSQLERNSARLKELNDQMDSLKEQIAETLREQLGMGRILDGRGGTGSKRAGADDDYGDSDDDDFFDRTTTRRGTKGILKRGAGPPGPNSASGAPQDIPDSETSLRAKLASVQAERAEVIHKQDMLSVERATLDAQAAADPLEAYMLANSAEVATSRAADLASRLTILKAEEARLQKLIDFVAPALPSTPAPPQSLMQPPAQPPAQPLAQQPPAQPPVKVSQRSSTQATTQLPSDAAKGSLHVESGDGASTALDGPRLGPAMPAAATGPAMPGVPDFTSTAKKQFQAQFAAAVTSLTSGAPGPIGEIGEEAGGEAPSTVAPLLADPSSSEASGDVVRGGLGFGASHPDRAQVAVAKQAMLVAQAKAAREAALLPGLNRSATSTAASSAASSAVDKPMGDGPLAKRPRQGPLMGPPAVAKSAKLAPKVAADEADFEWSAPADQAGDGKTSLNARLGY